MKVSTPDYPVPHFSNDEFTRNVSVWASLLTPFRERQATFLEVGVYEGRSTRWLMEHVVVHPRSRLFYVDCFQPTAETEVAGKADVEERFLRNLAPFHGQMIGLKGRSAERLRELPLRTFDFVHIDGSHAAPDVLSDACLSWLLLKRGGLLAFSAYGWVGASDARQCPKLGIDVFLSTMMGRFEVVHAGYQVWVRKSEET